MFYYVPFWWLISGIWLSLMYVYYCIKVFWMLNLNHCFDNNVWYFKRTNPSPAIIEMTRNVVISVNHHHCYTSKLWWFHSCVNIAWWMCHLHKDSSLGGDQNNQQVHRIFFHDRSWVRSRRCGCFVTWFCYHLIAKPGNKTATPSWHDPAAGFKQCFECFLSIYQAV